MAEEIEFAFKIPPEALPYLIVQKGQLDKLKGNLTQWEGAYNLSIWNTFHCIKPFLPEGKNISILDIGSGMGGIDAVLNWHYGGNCSINLLDGALDLPIVDRHNQTFNDMNIARNFLFQNGVKIFNYITPGEVATKKIAGNIQEYERFSQQRFDLVISFGAWCFHFPPGMYIDFVKSVIKPGTVLILDGRNDKMSWLYELIDAFGPGEIVRISKKFTKYQFIYGQ